MTASDMFGKTGGLAAWLFVAAGLALCLVLLGTPADFRSEAGPELKRAASIAAGSAVATDTPLPDNFQSVFPPANRNPSFEIPGVTGVAAGWAISGPAQAVSLERGNPRSGQYALQVTAGTQPVTLTGDPLAVGPGDFAGALAWFRADNAGETRVSLRIEGQRGSTWERIDLSGDKAVSREELNLPLSAHADWQPRSACVVVPSGIEQIRLVLQITGGPDRGKSVVRIDDAVIGTSSFRRAVQGEAARAGNTSDKPDFFLAVADALSVYFTSVHPEGKGYTPNLQALAEDGICFDNAFTPAPWTRPAFASLFTSRYPSQHGAELVNSVLPESAVTLAEKLREAGYYTAGFARTYYDGFVGPGSGMAQGFDLFYFSDDEDEVFRAVTAFLDENRDVIAAKNRRGLFLFVHFFEPHSSYINRFPALIRNAGSLGSLMTNQIIDAMVEKNENPDQTHRADMDYARACYASEVTFMDARVGELLFRLKHLGRYQDSLVVFTADHGESFGERPMVWNHGNPHVTSTRVPLILRVPGIEGGVRRSDPVSLLDIMPTLLDVAGIPVPEGLEGCSLIQAPSSVERLLVSEDKSRGIQGEGSITITDGRYKLTVWKASRRERAEDWTSSRWVLYDSLSPSQWELADLEQDPMELVNAATRLPEVFDRLKAALKAHCERTGITGGAGGGHGGEQKPLSEGAQEDLKSIGYL